MDTFTTRAYASPSSHYTACLPHTDLPSTAYSCCLVIPTANISPTRGFTAASRAPPYHTMLRHLPTIL